MAPTDKPAAKPAAKAQPAKAEVVEGSAKHAAAEAPAAAPTAAQAETKAPGVNKPEATAPAPERVEAEAPGVKDVGAGTDPGEQIAGTPAEGVKPADQDGTVPEATPNDLPEVPDTGAGVEEVKDGATNQPAPGSAPSLTTPMADTTADGGGTQAGGKTALPAQKVKAGELADSAEGVKGAGTAEQAKQHEDAPMLYIQGQDANVDDESPRRAIAENVPAVPENKRVADGLAESLAASVSDTKAQTTSFASRNRQAPYRQPVNASAE
jgi:hypothetical protein